MTKCKKIIHSPREENKQTNKRLPSNQDALLIARNILISKVLKVKKKKSVLAIQEK